jgi:DNA-binding winged helix-turn-helix (wHTH) protein
MSQSALNQRPAFDLESVVRSMPNHETPGTDRFALVPGKLSHFLDSGYSLGAPVNQLTTGTQLDLDRYRFVLIPQETAPSRAAKSLAQHPGPDELVILSWKDLVSRVCMELRAPSVPQRFSSNVAEFGDIHVDYISIEVRRSGRPVQLTPMEFKVLKFFLTHPDRVISRDELLNEVWGYNNYPCTRTVDNHVLRLRHKLEPDFATPIYFRTAPGFGYRFTPLGNNDSHPSLRSAVTDATRFHRGHSS